MKKHFLLPKSAKGQSLVELAISLVILLIILAGAVEFGIIFFQYVQLRDAAQEGALYGSIYPPSSAADTAAINAIIKRTKDSSSTPIDLANDPGVVVQVDVTDGIYCEGGSLRVRVSYPHDVIMPFMSTWLGPGRTLNAEVIDTILTPVCP
ncbi:MAG TPA: TadE/TadG family type IV pilus assembly protein [Anaerolineales bacterium]|nr:TadE/TadG family type IV pilus assembly protein [Anaerolineales bacterium]